MQFKLLIFATCAKTSAEDRHFWNSTSKFGISASQITTLWNSLFQIIASTSTFFVHHGTLNTLVHCNTIPPFEHFYLDFPGWISAILCWIISILGQKWDHNKYRAMLISIQDHIMQIFYSLKVAISLLVWIYGRQFQ